MQGVVQLAHGVLQDALSLGGRAPQHLELLIQEPLLQPLLPRLLGEGRRQLGDLPRRSLTAAGQDPAQPLTGEESEDWPSSTPRDGAPQECAGQLRNRKTNTS